MHGGAIVYRLPFNIGAEIRQISTLEIEKVTGYIITKENIFIVLGDNGYAIPLNDFTTYWTRTDKNTDELSVLFPFTVGITIEEEHGLVARILQYKITESEKLIGVSFNINTQYPSIDQEIPLAEIKGWTKTDKFNYYYDPNVNMQKYHENIQKKYLGYLENDGISINSKIGHKILAASGEFSRNRKRPGDN